MDVFLLILSKETAFDYYESSRLPYKGSWINYNVWELRSIPFPQVKPLTENPNVVMQKLLEHQANQNSTTFHIQTWNKNDWHKIETVRDIPGGPAAKTVCL